MSICIPTSKRENETRQKKKKETPPGRPLRPPSEGAFILSLAFGSLCVASQLALVTRVPGQAPSPL